MTGLRHEYVDRDCEGPVGEAEAVPGSFSASRREGAVELSRLQKTIETEVIPRLMLAHRAAPARMEPASIPASRPTQEDVEELGRLVLAHDERVGFQFVEALFASGMNPETIYLELLAPVAKHLGELWNEDRLTFSEVTLGLYRLHIVMHDLSPSFHSPAERGDRTNRVLLLPMPGEQHAFGITMVGEFFSRAGWEVHDEGAISASHLTELVRLHWFDIVGFSLACESRINSLASCIRAMRKASRNPGLGVMVGGRVFNEQPELAALVGADATATDGRLAVIQARNLLVSLDDRC